MHFDPQLQEFKTILNAKGVHEALKFLNSRTPHRYTGVYRFDGDTLRNVALFDRSEPSLQRGDDFAMKDAYCAEVGRSGKPLVFTDVRLETPVERGGTFVYKPGSPIISYCGILLRDAHGQPYGTLCHYDIKPCQQRLSDVPLLEAAAPFIVNALNAAA